MNCSCPANQPAPCTHRLHHLAPCPPAQQHSSGPQQRTHLSEPQDSLWDTSITASLKRAEQRGHTYTSPPPAAALRCCCGGGLGLPLCATSTCCISCCTSGNDALHCGQRSAPCVRCCCCCCHSSWRLCAVPYTEFAGSAYCCCCCCWRCVRACAAAAPLLLAFCAAAAAEAFQSDIMLLALVPKLRLAAAAAERAADAAADADWR